MKNALTTRTNAATADLFRHLNADKSALYRCILDVFASAKRQYRLQLRPDEVLAEGDWQDDAPRADELALALSTLTEWGNLEAQPDTARVATLTDFYRARFLYRLSRGGEAVETSLAVFYQTIQRHAELQTVALEDISSRLEGLKRLIDESDGKPDVAKAHQLLRDLIGVFQNLTENAQAFMAGVARNLELRQARERVVFEYKARLVEYLERFLGDLVRRTESIARLLDHLSPVINIVLEEVAEREAGDAAPGGEQNHADEKSRRWREWRDRWKGLRGWFITGKTEPSQAELLRARARGAIPQLLSAIATLNDRRSGQSDRSADFRTLAFWFAACANDGEAHRMARAAFALNPARHFSLNTQADDDLPATTRWEDAPALEISPRLHATGEAAPRGPLARIRDRSAERALMAEHLAEEFRQVEAARRRLATAQPVRLSELGNLDPLTFGLFLNLLGEALGEQKHPDEPVERHTGDGLFRIRLEPLAMGTQARIVTPTGIFCGRDHILTITPTQGVHHTQAQHEQST
ncbi:TIGR02677 family protein [Paraburkholderia bannensis]|uniref:TIGR02677 family protein n=1 Tax=Paraburkholderia bannensis TaxID=765414 RepID=UPI002ABD5A48|nr:TIGR02677 family protein [Paraburkholderia bannensis]